MPRIKTENQPSQSTQQPTQADPARDPRRSDAAPWLKTAPTPMIDACDRFISELQSAKTAKDATDLVRAFLAALEQLAKDPEAVSPIEASYSEKTIDVPGEGSFVVRVNSKEKVELTAIAMIGGTGIMPTESFAEDPMRAVRLVVSGAASPRQQGGVRRAKLTAVEAQAEKARVEKESGAQAA